MSTAVIPGRFQKGVSPNPGGRPSGLAKWRRALLAATDNGQDIFRWAIEIASGAADDKDRMDAVRFLASYAWGQPAKQLEVSGTVQHEHHARPNVDLDSVPLEVRRQMLQLVEDAEAEQVEDAEFTDAE